MFSKELEELIDLVIADNKITEQERRVIYTRAANEGITREEVDVVLEGRLAQKIKKESSVPPPLTTVPPPLPGTVQASPRKCPHCGGILPLIADVCPECERPVSPAVDSKLQEIINHLENALVASKSQDNFGRYKAEVERYIREAELFYGSNPKVKSLVAQVKAELAEAEKKARSKAYIRNIKSVLTYNKWLTAIVLFLIAWGVSTLFTKKAGPDPLYNAAACMEIANKQIKAGNLSEAQNTLFAFKKGTSHISSGLSELGKAYVEKGEYDNSVLVARRGTPDVQELIGRKLLEAGRYDDAYGLLKETYTISRYEAAVLVVEAMHNNGHDSRIKPFATKTMPDIVSFHGDEKAEAFKNLVESYM